MNYSLQATISDVSMPPIFFNEKIFFIDKSSGKLLALLNETMDVAWASSERMLSVDKAQGYLVCYGLNVFNPNGQLEFSGGAPYSYTDLECNGILMWKLMDNEKEAVSYSLFNVAKKAFVLKYFQLEGVPVLLLEDSVISWEDNYIKNIAIDSRSLGNVNWAFDISKFGKYVESDLPHLEPVEKACEVRKVFYHEGKILMTISRAVISLDPKTGALLWKIDLPLFDPIDIIFDGSLGYISERVYYAVIDVEKGLKLIDTELPVNVKVQDKQISFINAGSGLVLHDESLFLTCSERGIRYLIKLNKADGRFEDGMILRTKTNAYSPIFNSGRIYILTQDWELHVYG